MRVLSLKQPWAQLICLGLKDVEGRTWETPYRGKILIHASSAKPTKNFMEKLYDEDACEVMNEITFGNLSNPQSLPTSAIIGYATLTDIVDEHESPWAYPGLKNWVLEDAHLFETPITGVNGKLNLWNYPEISEDNLPPAYTADLRHPSLNDGTMDIPVTEERFDEALERGWLELEWSEGINDLIFGENREEENQVHSVELMSPTRLARIAEVEAFDCTQTDDNGQDIMVPSKSGDYIPLTIFAIEFKSKPSIVELTKQDVIDYCAGHDDEPWNLDKEGLKSVMHEALAVKAGYALLDGYYSILNIGSLISQIRQMPIEREIYTPTEKEIDAYCEKYGIYPKSLNEEERDTVIEELVEIQRDNPPFTSILFWKTDKPLSTLLCDC